MTVKISRKGSKLDHNGSKQISLDHLRVKYDSKSQSIIMSASNVKDFNSDKTHHDYTIEININEIKNILDTLTTQTAEHHEQLEVILEPILKPLIKLQYIASGTYRFHASKT